MFNIKIKEEDNENLSKFIHEINDGDQGTIVTVENEADEEDDDDEGGTYFVDDAGNYYYQESKDSVPVLTDPPEGLIENDEEPMEEYEVLEEDSFIKKTDNAKDKKDYNYSIVVMEEKEEKPNEIHEYEFNETEIAEFKDPDEINPYDVKFVKKTEPIKQKGTNHLCGYCGYTSTKRYLLARHLKSHSDERPFKCSVCERGFKTNASLINHVNTHTGNKPYPCKFCTSNFTTSGELVRHVRYRHTHERPHKCTECDYASVELSKLRRHIRCHTGERPYQCPHCTYASPDTFKLKRHLRIHTGEKPYECDICHAKFTQSNSLKAHRLIHNVGEKPIFQCELCPTTCGRKTDLRIHVQKLHTSDKPLPCKKCGKSFPDRHSYKLHLKTHEGEKCFRCSLCPYASVSERQLEIHQLIHTDEKPFECEYCEQTFRQKQLLKRHVNLYHNVDYIPPEPKPKIHNCPDCEKSFSHKGNLIRHMATHDPESKLEEEKLMLKKGRKKKIKVIDGALVTIVPEDDESMDENDTTNLEEEYDFELENNVAKIKVKTEPNDLDKKMNNEYVVLEVLEDDDKDALSENQNFEDSRDCSFDNSKEEKSENSGGSNSKYDKTNYIRDCFGFEEEYNVNEYSMDEL